MATGNDLVTIAAGEIGKPYVYGAEDPRAGFDCSGLVQWVAAQLGISVPRTAAQQQAAAVPTTSPVPGDLVFYGRPAHHVGIYAGNGRMISAPSPGAHVHLTDVGSPTGYGRIKGIGGVSGALRTVADTTAAAYGSIGERSRSIMLEVAFLMLGAGLLGVGLWRSLDPATRTGIRARVKGVVP